MTKQSAICTAGRKTPKPASSIRKPAGKSRKPKPEPKTAPRRTAKSVTGVLRLPAVGEKLTRTYKGKEIVVEVIEGGFKYQGETYTSLSALAKKITGYPAISGPAFFGLWKSAAAEEK